MRNFNLQDFNSAAIFDNAIQNFDDIAISQNEIENSPESARGNAEVHDFRCFATGGVEFHGAKSQANTEIQSGFRNFLENIEEKTYKSITENTKSHNNSKVFSKFSYTKPQTKEMMLEPANNAAIDDDVAPCLGDGIESTTPKEMIKNEAFDSGLNGDFDDLNQRIVIDHQEINEQIANVIAKKHSDHDSIIAYGDNDMSNNYLETRQEKTESAQHGAIAQQDQLVQHNNISLRYQQQQEQLSLCINNIKQSLHDFKSQFVSLLGNYREDVITMAYEISSKITESVRNYIPEKVVRDFLQQHLALLIDDYAVIIELHPSIKRKVENLIKEELSSVELNNIEFIENSKIVIGDCVIKFAEGKIIKNKELILQELNAILAHYMTNTNQQI